MYRRGRPGRERSRDTSRPFSQGRDRDREHDSRFRREERPRGHWEDLDRRVEDRRRDDRPHASLPPPAGPPLGPGHPSELSNFTRDSSKGPNNRRESRDGARDPLPVDAARRHSGGSTSLRKDFSEPSPRERGMIGDPQVLPRRQISTSWQPRDGGGGGGDERDRSDTAQSPLDLAPDQQSRSPVIGSPRGFVPESPATSISTGTALNMAPSAPPSMPNNLGTGVDKNLLSRIFQEASYAFAKYQETQISWKIAEKERLDHAEHFNTFPVLKERYEGNARTAKKELQNASETLAKKSTLLDQLCTRLVEDRLSQRDTDAAIEFHDKLKRELGNSSSLAQFIRANIPPPVPAQPNDEFLQLRKEFLVMKRKQEEEEKSRQTLASEFLNYKNEQANRLRTQDLKLARFESDIAHFRDENRKTADELRKVLSLLATTKNSVDKLQETNNQKDAVMTDVVNEGALNEVRQILENLQKEAMASQKTLLETSTRCKDIDANMVRVNSEAQALQQKVSALEESSIARKNEPVENPHHGCATNEDIERLVVSIKCQDDLLDEFRGGAERDTQDILDELTKLDRKTEAHIQTTDQQIREHEQKITNQITALTTEQQAATAKYDTEFKDLDDKLGRQFAQLETKFQGNVERLDDRVTSVENHLESHLLAITHQEQRMNSFTTKDFYERVVESLVRINPLLFNYTNQLQLCTNEIKAIKENIRILNLQLDATKQRLAITSQSPRNAMPDGSVDPSPNGAGFKADRLSEGPSPPLTQILKDLELHTDQIKKLDLRISDHIQTYMAKMSDIKEWTVSCTQRLADNTTSAALIMEDVGKLRDYLTNQGAENAHVPTTVSATDRWRVVSSNQDAMQGLSDGNGTG